MLSTILKTLAPLLSLFIFMLGNGLFTTLVVLRLHMDHASSLMIGAMTASYYLGLGCGSFRIEPFIVRVGHIRAFAAFASTLAVVSVFQGMIINTWLWLFLRFIGGFATAGLFVVIESWLLVQSAVNIRGQILAIYMVSLYGGQALGQFFINVGDPQSLLLFAIAAMLCSLSVIPLAMTHISSPKIEEPSTLSFRKLYYVSASGVIGCFCSGLVLGASYGLVPLFVSENAGTPTLVSIIMAVTILGGMALQYPVGRLSDYIERRVVLIIICVLALVLSLAVITFFKHHVMSYVVFFLFGGMTFTLYPLSISHACDQLAPKDIVAGTQGLLLAYSIGATLGPLIAPLFMGVFGSNGLFIYFIVITGFLAMFFVWRKTRRVAFPQEEHFITMPQTTPVMSELDPRSEAVAATEAKHE
ncbi:MAG: MFS transporter [Coxiella sp. RIFCSPHIGHO2_12_FULL_44_14]|nr:MAG: MFS transporter [Coxiella sp. RIFCSPHIGHO2_12_FULL_44_14]